MIKYSEPLFFFPFLTVENPLDDIPDENHREFMKEYLRVWPYPPQTQYKVGQSLKAEYEGIMQKCEVVTVDSSLIEVIFEVSVRLLINYFVTIFTFECKMFLFMFIFRLINIRSGSTGARCAWNIWSI